MLSLRRRVLIGGAISAVVSIAIASAILFAYVDAVTLNRFDKVLNDRHVQIAVALSYHGDDPSALETVLSEPAYQRPLSGRYWQVEGPDGARYSSPSLFGENLVPNAPATKALTAWSGTGPDGNGLRGMQQLVTLADGTKWVVKVAQDLRDLQTERDYTRRSLLLAFAFVAAFGLLGALLQATAILRPLNRLRDDVAIRWERGNGMDPGAYPAEVAPLVEDINTLIRRNQDVVARARRQTADMAHALKTPSAILRNELQDLSRNGHDMQRALEALDRVDSQLTRCLARMRAANSASGLAEAVDLGRSIRRFARTFAKMAEHDSKSVEIDAAAELRARMDVQDFEEILGNLMDNALKWSRSRIRLSAGERQGNTCLCVEDDGDGIPEELRGLALDSGRRLDSSKPGTGLGLAIVADLVAAYGGTLQLAQSPRLGGLSVTVILPGQFATMLDAAE